MNSEFWVVSIFLRNFADIAPLSSVSKVAVKKYSVMMFNLLHMTCFAFIFLFRRILQSLFVWFLKVYDHVPFWESFFILCAGLLVGSFNLETSSLEIILYYVSDSFFPSVILPSPVLFLPLTFVSRILCLLDWSFHHSFCFLISVSLYSSR